MGGGVDHTGDSMKPANLILRCYAEQESDNTWFVMCVDLNLYARADTLVGAKRNLHSFISDYVKEACTTDAQYIGDLIPRQAPLYFQLRYRWIWLKSLIHAAKRRMTFVEALPLVPA